MYGSSAPLREKVKRDEALWWRPGRIYRPVWQMQGLIISTNNVSAGTGTSTIQELSTFEVTALRMAASANTISDFIELPYDIDLTKHIYFSVVWSASGTSGSCQWVVNYTPFIVGTTAVTAAPATALNFVIANQTTSGTANTITRSPEGFINPGTLGDNVEYLSIKLTDTLTTLASVDLWGYTIRYSPKRMRYGSMAEPAKQPTYIASDKYAN